MEMKSLTGKGFAKQWRRLVVPWAIAMLILYGCANPQPESVTPMATDTESASPAPAPTGNGLTYEENLSINPPPPSNVRVSEVKAGAVHLVWDPPPPVEVPHSYSDRVVSYQIFRRQAGELEFRPLATTPDLEYTDTTVSSGQTYEYAVSSIREQNAEGTLSDPPVTATVP
jgi:fibronectin type 3 domain-containing protein